MGAARRSSARASAPASPTDGVEAAPQILDNQWLGTLLEIGAVGVIGLWWLFIRAIRRLARRAREAGRGRQLARDGAGRSLLAWTIGMFTFDAFAFIQVTFFVFIMLGFASVVLRADPER